MHLVAIEKNTGQESHLTLQDGKAFVLGRQPNVDLATQHSGLNEFEQLVIGEAYGTVSRTHVWGERKGETLTVNRIPPAPGKQTPHPMYSVFGKRQQLPDSIVLDPGQCFAIHPDGWLEIYW